jgi:hypothetical protein
MKEPQHLTSGIDLKEFFEASVSALRQATQSDSQHLADQRKRALVQRKVSDGTLTDRAVTDAARALAALWKMQAPKRTV